MDPRYYLSETIKVPGASLELYRYYSDLPKEGDRPVALLCSGFGNNVSVYSLLGEESIPSYLYNAGYDVYLFDLRGHGKSKLDENTVAWDLSTYIFVDTLSIIQHILLQTKANQIHFIGHSMGGMIGLALASCKSTAKLLKSVTALGSSIYLAHTIWKYLIYFTPLYPLAKVQGNIDVGWHAWMASNVLQFTSCLQIPSCGFDIVASSSNADNRLTHKMMNESFCKEGIGVIDEMKEGISGNGLRIKYPASVTNTEIEDDYVYIDVNDEEIHGNSLITTEYLIESTIGVHTTSIGLLYGYDDPQILEEDVIKLANKINDNRSISTSSSQKQCFIKGFGTKYNDPPYSHYDMLIGNDAPTKVFPVLLHFLQSSA
jgi:alpha/beta superfamily hydrolase